MSKQKWEFTQLQREINKTLLDYHNGTITEDQKDARKKELFELSGWTEEDFWADYEDRIPF